MFYAFCFYTTHWHKQAEYPPSVRREVLHSTAHQHILCWLPRSKTSSLKDASDVFIRYHKKDPRTSIRVFVTLELSADHIDMYNEKALFLRSQGSRSNKHNKLLDALQAHMLSLVPPQCSTTETARWLSKTFELEEQRRSVFCSRKSAFCTWAFLAHRVPELGQQNCLQKYS